MIAWAAKYFSAIPPVFIDGLLYCSIGFFAFSQMFFGGDEAAKYIRPDIKFYLNYILGAGAIIASQLKSFRSNQFAEHQAEKKKNGGNTSFFTGGPETSTKP